MKDRLPIVFGAVVFSLFVLLIFDFSLMRKASRLENKITDLQKKIEILNESTPGLGDYMNSIQLHLGKLWFAGQAQNWDLAIYEVLEIEETVTKISVLHLSKNNVDVGLELQAVLGKQLSELKDTLHQKNAETFRAVYSKTVSACNECYGAMGLGFVRVKIPTAPSVTNQDWSLAPEKGSGEAQTKGKKAAKTSHSKAKKTKRSR